MASVTVQSTSETYGKLRELSRESGESIPTILDKAVEAYRRQIFFRELDAEFARLREDPAEWAEEQAERRLWDATLSDGLEDD